MGWTNARQRGKIHLARATLIVTRKMPSTFGPVNKTSKNPVVLLSPCIRD